MRLRLDNLLFFILRRLNRKNIDIKELQKRKKQSIHNNKNAKMATKSIIRFYFLFILVVMSLSFASASDLHIFTGNVTIGSNTTTTGAFVATYINGIMKVNCTVGINCGPSIYQYYLTVPGNNGDSLVFTVYNVTANDTHTFSASSITKLNLTITQLADSATCAYSEACSGGYCCSGASEYHGNGIGTCQATACSAPAQTPSGGSGGGGGGGGTTVISESKYTGSIPAGESKSVSFIKAELKVTSIEVTTTEQVSNIGITVKESSAPAANLAIAAEEGKAYKYLEITKTVEDKSIRQVKISFKVEKSWFESNGLNPATTVLKKLVNNVWQDLPTSKVSEDGTYVYFEATSDTLSKFAITAKKTGAVITPPAGEVKPCGDAVCNATAGENCATCVQDCTCKSGEECKAGICQEVPKSTITKPRVKIEILVKIASIILIAIILIAAIIFLSKRKK